MIRKRLYCLLLAAASTVASGCSGDNDSDILDPLTEVADTLRFTTLAAGARHTCGLGVDGATYCWGFGGDGQKGPGSTNAPAVPRRLETELHFSALAAGSQSTCGIERDLGTVHCWGRLGGGSSSPTLIQDSQGAVQLSMTIDHVCLRFDDDRVGCFGAAGHGQLGPGVSPGPELRHSVVMVPGVSTIQPPVVGHRHSCALDATGTASCWGLHEAGQLGIGDPVEECPIGPGGASRPCSRDPAPVSAGSPYVSVVSGLYHGCGLRLDSRAECWGDDESGQLGLGMEASETCEWLVSTSADNRRCSRAPRAVTGDFVFVRLASGFFHTCGIEEDGDAYCWGTDSFGQLGGQGGRGQPGLVVGGHRWASIAGGQVHTCGLTVSGEAYCWGDGQFGQLGSRHEHSPLPRLVGGAGN